MSNPFSTENLLGVSKGAMVGHSFNGNQYTGGQGGGEKAPVRQEDPNRWTPRQSLLSDGAFFATAHDQQGALRMAQQHALLASKAQSSGDDKGAKLHQLAYKKWNAIYNMPASKTQDDDVWAPAVQATQRAANYEPSARDRVAQSMLNEG